MSSTYNGDFSTFHFLYRVLANQYHSMKGEIHGDHREGFEVMYLNDGASLKKFVDKHSQGKVTELSGDVMDAAWRRIEGMEHTLIALINEPVAA